MKRMGTVAVLYFLVVPLLAAADYLEVRHNANVYTEPNRQSEKVRRIDIADRDGPYLVRLLQDAKVNGYYKVRLPGQSREGWIYKTLVRRFQEPRPLYRPYKRSFYRHWIDEDTDCQNTRNEVLIRDDDDGVVEFQDEDGCKVLSGTWIDPYTGETFHEPRQLDVDHMVPLQNAHESGAWAWSPERRRAYANALQDKQHLLAVKASENRRKGAKGPDQYLPPLASFHCEYVEVWLRIKQAWELELTEAEGEAVERVLVTCP